MRAVAVLVVLACLLVPPAFASADWCDQISDWIYAEVDQGTITVHHDAAFYNCGLDSTGYGWTTSNDTLAVVETGFFTPAMCFCCFELTTTMTQVPPGDYVIDFLWDDFGYGPRHRYLSVTVPDEGQSGDPAVGDHTKSSCIQSQPSSSVPAAAGGAAPLLRPVEPNPVGERATLRFATPVAGRVTLAVYAADGSLVRLVLDEDLAAGSYTAFWDGRDDLGRRVAQGVYFAGAAMGGEQSVRRVLLIR
jgi:hypothetical protein